MINKTNYISTTDKKENFSLDYFVKCVNDMNNYQQRTDKIKHIDYMSIIQKKPISKDKQQKLDKLYNKLIEHNKKYFDDNIDTLSLSTCDSTSSNKKEYFSLDDLFELIDNIKIQQINNLPTYKLKFDNIDPKNPKIYILEIINNNKLIPDIKSINVCKIPSTLTCHMDRKIFTKIPLIVLDYLGIPRDKGWIYEI